MARAAPQTDRLVQEGLESLCQTFLRLKPVLVGQFEFVEWTGEHHLRHSRFMGLRDDTRPQDVVRER
jgi:ATP-dependent DNA ligase